MFENYLNGLFGIQDSNTPQLNPFDNMFNGMDELTNIDINTGLQNQQLGLSNLNFDNEQFKKIFNNNNELLQDGDIDLINNIFEQTEIKDLNELTEVVNGNNTMGL